ncbi:hypothetical protein Q3G72_031931 [Acer saccharum]|nr:hypothetical protein Q3G72_031931 [Acer saccharum]
MLLGIEPLLHLHYHGNHLFNEMSQACKPLHQRVDIQGWYTWNKTATQQGSHSSPAIGALRLFQLIGHLSGTRTAPKYGCPYKCDYNQTYDGGNKCVTNCGKSTQRYYHIPREFLDNRENVLVLFEEFGGTLDDVTVQTVTVGTVCAHAYDNNNLELSCQGGRVFTDITFASFGDPEGTCGSFKRGTCEAPWALSYIQNNCIGRESCVIPVSEYYLGPTSCHSTEYRLALSHNNLSGAIPNSFYGMSSLSFFNLSYNHLEGEIRGSFLERYSLEAVIGNKDLCSDFYALPPCAPTLQLASQHKRQKKRPTLPSLPDIEDVAGNPCFIFIIMATICSMKCPRLAMQLIDYAANITKDLSTNEWIYKVGIHGIKQQLNKVHTRHQHNWSAEALPTNRSFVWYKVNGKSIGRYWPRRTAPKYGCPYKCDYNQTYDGGNKCVTNCGKSTQRYYHIPREFLDNRENVLVLFEEFGGTLDDVTVQTVTVGTVCAQAYDNNNLELSCQGGRVFTDIRFASFGDPEGTCGSFKRCTCEAPWALSYMQNSCIGRESCVIPVSEYYLGPTSCHSTGYRLAFEAVC